NRHVALDDVVGVGHGDDEAAADQEGTESFGGCHFIERSPASRLAILPCFTAISSARMLTAISCGVTAPMSRPMGAWTCLSASADSSSFDSSSYMRATFARLPMSPR